MIQFDRGAISTVVLSTALGPWGRGIFPYTLWPPYRRLVRVVQDTGTAVFSKSFTRFPRRGNFLAYNPLTWRYIRRLPDLGMLNAYGLTNAGIEAGARMLRVSGEQGFPAIPNFYPEFGRGTFQAIRETLQAVEILQQVLGARFWALELNFSCPNVQEAISANVVQGIRCIREIKQRFPDLVLVAKISICHPLEFAQELERAGADVIHGINSIPYEILFPPPGHPRSPLWQVGGGGVSGGPAFKEAYRYNQVLRQRVALPLIMGCGVSRADDVRRYLDLGADAVSICTLALRRPQVVAEIVRAYHG
jgi:dihydroorotate dehydrogenase